MPTAFRFLLLCLLLIVQGCDDSPLNPEHEIRQYIDRGIEAAEARDVSEMLDMAHDDYRDDRKMTKQQMGRMLRLYFLQHKNIHLFKKINEIVLHNTNEATVKLHVAMAGTVISDASVLSSLRARVYEFELQLVKPEQEWLLQQARWRPANLSALE